MLPDRVSNPGPLTYESGALIALRGPALVGEESLELKYVKGCFIPFFFRRCVLSFSGLLEVSYNFYILEPKVEDYRIAIVCE